jgi:hypothetical protein
VVEKVPMLLLIVRKKRFLAGIRQSEPTCDREAGLTNLSPKFFETFWRIQRLIQQLLLRTMKSIVTTYPGFQALPRGIKQLLVTSESLFFDEARPELQPPSVLKPGHSFRRLRAETFGNGIRGLSGDWIKPARQHSLATI